MLEPTGAPDALGADTGIDTGNPDAHSEHAADPGAMTDSDGPGAGGEDQPGSAAPQRRRRASGLAGMVLPELQALASNLGISGAARLRKGQLIAAIQMAQAGNGGAGGAAGEGAGTVGLRPPEGPGVSAQGEAAPWQQSLPTDTADTAGVRDAEGADADGATDELDAGGMTRQRRPRRASRDAGGPSAAENGVRTEEGQRAFDGGDGRGRRDGRGGDGRGAEGRVDAPQREGTQREPGQREGRPDNQRERQNFRDDEYGGGRRRNRYRDRQRRGRDRFGGDAEPVISEDEVLLPIAGILDIFDKNDKTYAFVRTSGYLSGPTDVYVSQALVRKYALRRGDAVTGAVRATQESDRETHKPLVRLDTINGIDPEESKRRPEFTKLTPLYPNERLRLETEPHVLTTRVIDLVMPIGKGQRALIVSPPKAGKTMVLQAIANAVTTNNPECHLMVVLVDERPEEVTDMQRSVKGEVIASTFDRPPSDHTNVAELSIERAKRLVELGHDVVVLLDSITRLGRAYNLAAPASGRILSGGVDSTALYPPKRFLGAARNIEHGGSLTILATALVETGSAMDTVIFEEFKGTGNAELKLDRKLADKRVFPAVDVPASGTRKEELILGPEELAISHKLRRVLHALESGPALELLLDKLRQTRTNYEFMMQIAKTTPGE
jgi:transcription termination factor Rho